MYTTKHAKEMPKEIKPKGNYADRNQTFGVGMENLRKYLVNVMGNKEALFKKSSLSQCKYIYLKTVKCLN